MVLALINDNNPAFGTKRQTFIQCMLGKLWHEFVIL